MLLMNQTELLLGVIGQLWTKSGPQWAVYIVYTRWKRQSIDQLNSTQLNLCIITFASVFDQPCPHPTLNDVSPTHLKRKVPSQAAQL
jgi:hypothetical protein